MDSLSAVTNAPHALKNAYTVVPPVIHRQKTAVCSPDGVVRAETDPVRDRPVLLHLLAQGHLGAEGLVGRLWMRETPHSRAIVFFSPTGARAIACLDADRKERDG